MITTKKSCGGLGGNASRLRAGGGAGESNKIRKNLRQRVVSAAARQLPGLPPPERADLLDGLACVISDPADRELARYTAGLIRLAEEHQLEVVQRLTGR